MSASRLLGSSRIASISLAPLLLAGCIYTPTLVTRTEAGCEFEQRHMTLTAHESGLFLLQGLQCGSDACLSVLAVQAALTPVSAIVSGSIVLIGNTVFWMQERGQCKSLHDDSPQPAPVAATLT